MTDKDIIDGLACCGRYGTGCAECPYKGGYPCSEVLIDDASALLDRKMQEIEDLNATIHSVITAQADWANNLIRTSLEAFANSVLKDICEQISAPTPTESSIVERCNAIIQKRLDEWAGENNE